ncbi:biopolymer transporter ExbD [Oxalobacteraceae bacterium R-40]|uniref:Biopolymer transporter ExbD n=1 Tax=Keguizhuia sedimenti TaxID=3064264 RepID=A0ABU1BSG3_9BURK|nr:biopolymer transporter ExbD [Oxalobacteraceae bacterium R-40]
MAFQPNGSKTPHASPMAEINTTPLVDVMLVLLVIFLITAPLFNQAVPIDLPKVEAGKINETPRSLQVAIDAGGSILVDGATIELAFLPEHLRTVKGAGDAPEIHLRADRATRYERVAEVMASVQSAGMSKIAFVTEKPRSGRADVN